jgi:hypothetical protein
MSSPFPRDINISVTIPATIKALMVIAAYLIYFNVVKSCCIEHLLIVVALVQKKGPIPFPILVIFLVHILDVFVRLPQVTHQVARVNAGAGGLLRHRYRNRLLSGVDAVLL